MAKRLTNEQWLSMVQDCRSSGLTDRAWCALHDIHPTSFYRAIKRLRNIACTIPDHKQNAISMSQEVVEVASIDENGIITPTQHAASVQKSTADNTLITYDSKLNNPVFECTVRITMPSGIQVELSNSTNAATIRCLLSALQSL